MPYRHLLDSEHRLGVIRLSGSIYGADLTKAIEALYEDPAWEPPYSALWDFREVTMLALLPRDSDAINRLFQRLENRLAEPGRTAVIARRQIDRLTAKLILRRRERFVDRPAKVYFCVGPTASGVPDRAVRQAAEWLGVPVEVLMAEPESEGA